MNSALVIIAMSVVGIDYGWEDTAQGEQEYIIQLEPELLNRLRDGEIVTSEILPEVKGVRRFRIQVGTGVLPKGKSTINVGDTDFVPNDATKDSSLESDSAQATDIELKVEDAADKDTPSETIPSDTTEDTFNLDVDSNDPYSPKDLDDTFQLPNDSSDTSLINPDETIATHFANKKPAEFTGIYDGGNTIPVPETTAGLLEHIVTIATTIIEKPSVENGFEDSDQDASKDSEPTGIENEFSLPANLSDLAEVNPGVVGAEEGLYAPGAIDLASIVLEGDSDVNSIAKSDIANEFELATPATNDSVTDENDGGAVVGIAPVMAQGVSRPWGTLIILCLCLFGSVGANIYMAYMLTVMMRKRKLLAE